jgi:hypothetical protein
VTPGPAPPSYWLTRFVFFRLLGLVYTVAFLVVLFQWEALLGSRGLLPVAALLDEMGSRWGQGLGAFFRLPTLFWWGPPTRPSRAPPCSGSGWLSRSYSDGPTRRASSPSGSSSS